MPRRYHLVLNVNSGTVQALGVSADDLKSLFSAQGLDVTIDADPDADLSRRIERALASDADTIIAAGGDGTATALAAAIVQSGASGKSLAVLPLGTANLLARDLGLSLDLEEGIEALAGLEPVEIDVSEVNGQIFLHKAVIGVIPELAAGREKIRGQGGAALVGYLRYFFRRVSRARRIALEITPEDGEARIERVQAIAVASNSYDEGPGRFFHRERLDTGLLTVYVLRHLRVLDLLRLSAGMVAGHWRDDDVLEISSARRVTIRSRKPRLQLMIDGEVTSMQVPLEFTIHPRALTILAPAGSAAGQTASPDTAGQPA